MNQYLELLSFWFTKNKGNWFGCSKDTDIFISQKYKDLLLNEQMPTFDELMYMPLNIILAKVILCDQISRHVFRNENKEMIKHYDKIALELSGIIEEEDRHYLFSPDERVFLLMPYRHTFDMSYLNKCLYFINKWRNENDAPIYTRFYYATLKAIVKVNDENTNKQMLLYHKTKDWSYNEINNILDKNSNIKTDDYSGFIYEEFVKNIPITYNGPLTVSISGGVDSMVCLFLLKQLFNKNSNIQPQAIAINYKNREEQDIEIYMVNKYCRDLNIPLYVREINEIYRTRDGDRQFYEEITRTIRFNAYQKMDGPIILGHNLDDSIENIFCNIRKQKNYDNLFGMSVDSTERNITIWRPLLSVSKKEIISFARKNGIPYTYDSTPAWSDRGKMRDKLIPFLNDFDSNILTGLVNMCNNFKEIYKIYEKAIPFIEYHDNYCIIHHDYDKEIYFEDYWKRILGTISEKYGFEYVKNKSVKNMIEKIMTGSNDRITLSKNMVLKMQKDNNICINIYL